MAALPPAAFLSPVQRYIRLNEGSGGAVAAGSFGRVYVAVDAVTNKTVAVKRQNVPNDQAVAEFLAYCTLAHFRHPNVMQLLNHFTSGTAEGHHVLYMVFELADTSLMQVFKSPLHQRGRMPSASVANYICGAVQGCGHLHGLSIAHGDLSLGNVLVGRDGNAMIGDLGSAHSAHDMLVKNVGTTSYVRAPETWLPDVLKKSTPAIDVWALGILALCLLIGEAMPIGPYLADLHAVGALMRTHFHSLAPLGLRRVGGGCCCTGG